MADSYDSERGGMVAETERDDSERLTGFDDRLTDISDSKATFVTEWHGLGF